MSTIGSIDGRIAGGGAQPAASGAELAKLKSQLSDWVNCPSGKTLAGKAHIAEITRKIDAIKAQEQKAAVQKTAESSAPALRLDGLGTHLDVQA